MFHRMVRRTVMGAAVVGMTFGGAASKAGPPSKGQDALLTGLGVGIAAVGITNGISNVVRSAQPETLYVGNSAGAFGGGIFGGAGAYANQQVVYSRGGLGGFGGGGGGYSAPSSYGYAPTQVQYVQQQPQYYQQPQAQYVQQQPQYYQQPQVQYVQQQPQYAPQPQYYQQPQAQYAPQQPQYYQQPPVQYAPQPQYRYAGYGIR